MERTAAVTPKDTYAEGSGGHEDGQSDSFLYTYYLECLSIVPKICIAFFIAPITLF